MRLIDIYSVACESSGALVIEMYDCIANTIYNTDLGDIIPLLLTNRIGFDHYDAVYPTSCDNRFLPEKTHKVQCSQLRNQPQAVEI